MYKYSIECKKSIGKSKKIYLFLSISKYNFSIQSATSWKIKKVPRKNAILNIIKKSIAHFTAFYAQNKTKQNFISILVDYLLCILEFVDYLFC